MISVREFGSCFQVCSLCQLARSIKWLLCLSEAVCDDEYIFILVVNLLCTLQCDGRSEKWLNWTTLKGCVVINQFECATVCLLPNAQQMAMNRSKKFLILFVCSVTRAWLVCIFAQPLGFKFWPVAHHLVTKHDPTEWSVLACWNSRAPIRMNWIIYAAIVCLSNCLTGMSNTSRSV
jgi:hypothetical protein